ncbi:MAG: hypothetical protein H6741_21640 [Alphaproteobacteria bacterium]|nr:hypothetical protein [Alphaproteobacteria bacterium]MCB9795315.1 hypothetical protein [Alphaproteobacteria bacterium]
MLVLMLLACDPAPDDSDWIDNDDTVFTADDSGGAVDTADSAEELWGITWNEACNPFSMAGDCLTPYPSVWYTVPADSPTGLRLALDNDAFLSPDGPLPLDLELFNQADGVSPVQPILINLGRDVHESFLSGWGEQGDTVQDGAPIQLLNAETGEALPILTEMDAANRDLEGYEGRHALIIRPMAPMDFGARYVVTLSSALTDTDGEAFSAPEPFVALRDGIRTSDPAIEALRPRYQSLLDTLDAAGQPREDLLLAWELQVASEDYARGPLLSMKEQALEGAAQIPYVIDSVEVDPDPNVAWLVKGRFTPMNFLLEDDTLSLDADFDAVPIEGGDSYDFTLTLPPQARTQGGLPLVLIGHGMFGTGEGMLDGRNARELLYPFAAELGLVMVATDWIGFSGGDLDLIISEVLGDLGRVQLITDRLAQGQINTMSLVERVAAGLGDDSAIARAVDQPLVDPERVYYYGISLGGIEGSTQLGISPRISRGVVAVPGAGWSNMIQRSTQFAPLEAIIDALYPDPLSQQLFIGAMQSFFDRADPAIFAPLIAASGPELVAAERKVVVIQEAIGDCQVPNIATDLLARAMGAQHLELATDPVWGLEVEAGPSLGPSLTQVRVPDLLEAYFPPDENTQPITDNGVHNAAVLQEATFYQVRHLMVEGEIIHPCEGSCDPD